MIARRTKAPPEPNPSEQAFRAFVRASALFRNVMVPYFARHGLSGAQWGVLRALHRALNENSLSLRQKDLGQWLLVRPPSVTVLVDRLERLGLVSKRRAATDGRAKEVALTPKGRAIVEKVLRRHPGQIRMVMEGLSPEQAATLLRLMEVWSIHLERLSAGDRSEGTHR